VGVALTCGVARLETKSIEEEMEVNDVSGLAVGVGLSIGGPSVFRNKRGVNVVKDVSPDFANFYCRKK